MKQNNELLTRRVEKILPGREGLKKLISERKIRLYLGIDPTGFQLHIGHGVVLKKIQEFIDAGHEVIFLVGSFTGKIGDPSDREAERISLTDDQIEKNMADYRSQAGKIVDFSRANFVYNGDWLSKLTFEDVVKLASNFTVQQLIERDMFQKRLKAGKPIHLHEFLYPLMQGYDSVHLEVDLEIGGKDQLFNMMAGRTLLKALKNKDKFVLTTPLLIGTNGQKMSKSVGNCIWLNDSAEDMFGKLMSVPDEQIIPYMELVSDIPLMRIAQVKTEIAAGKLHPMDAKKELSFDVVSQFHGKNQAESAKINFEKTVQAGETPAEIPTFNLSSLPENATIIDLLEKSKTISSRGEGKRLIDQKAVSVNQLPITNFSGNGGSRSAGQFPISELKSGDIIKIGKRNWIKLID